MRLRRIADLPRLPPISAVPFPDHNAHSAEDDHGSGPIGSGGRAVGKQKARRTGPG